MKSILTAPLVLATVLSLSSSLSAQEPTWSHEASFTEYLAKMNRNNPALHAASSRTNAAQERVSHADKLPNPSVKLGHFIEPVETRTGPQETVFSLSQNLPWFGMRHAQRHSAVSRAESIHAHSEELRLAMARTLASTFYEYVYIGKATDLTQQNVQLLRTLAPVVEARVAAGGNLNALLRIKVETGKLADHLQSLTAKRESVSAQLDALLNEDTTGFRPWPSVAPPPHILLPEEDHLPELNRNNAKLVAQRKEVKTAKNALRVTELAGMPTFSLGVTYIQLGDSATNSPASIDADDPLNVMVGFQIPLWRGAEKARQAEALNRIDEKAYLEQHLIAELQAELTQKVSQHTDALRRLRVYGDELLDLARQAVENSRAGYENGNTSLLEWIDSERSLLSLELDYWRAVADAHMHRIHIRTLTVPNLQTLLHEEN